MILYNYKINVQNCILPFLGFNKIKLSNINNEILFTINYLKYIIYKPPSLITCFMPHFPLSIIYYSPPNLSTTTNTLHKSNSPFSTKLHLPFSKIPPSTPSPQVVWHYLIGYSPTKPSPHTTFTSPSNNPLDNNQSPLIG